MLVTMSLQGTTSSHVRMRGLEKEVLVESLTGMMKLTKMEQDQERQILRRNTLLFLPSCSMLGSDVISPYMHEEEGKGK